MAVSCDILSSLCVDLTQLYQREQLNGHGSDHPLCNWGDVSLENMFLTRMVRVSKASWQPEILVEWPSVAS